MRTMLLTIGGYALFIIGIGMLIDWQPIGLREIGGIICITIAGAVLDQRYQPLGRRVRS